MGWLFLTIASAVAGSIARILQKVLLKNVESDPFAFSFVFQIMVAILFLIYAVATNTLEFPSLAGLSINLIVMTMFYALGNVFTFKAFKLAEASEVSVIFASSSVWAVLSAIVMLGEKISTRNMAGIALVVLGIVTINYQSSNWKLNKGHVFALLGAMLFGIAFTNDAYVIGRYQSISSYMVLAFTLPALMTLLINPKSIRNLGQYTKLSVMPSLLLCTTLYALSAIAIFSAYKAGGPASIISPVSQTSLIFTVTLGYIFLKERDQLLKKIIGTALTFGGILLLV